MLALTTLTCLSTTTVHAQEVVISPPPPYATTAPGYARPLSPELIDMVEDLHRRGVHKKVAGGLMMGFGFAAALAGVAVEIWRPDLSTEAGATIAIGGLTGLVGIPIYAVGVHQVRKANRIRASLGIAPQYSATGAGGTMNLALVY
jgi:hypothetical protein